jgi:hypothetical protein
MSSKWVSLASAAVSSFVLKNVRVQDVGIQTVLSSLDEVSVQLSEPIPRQIIERAVTEITEEMRDGPRPPQYAKKQDSVTGKLMLVHGKQSKERKK